MPLSPRRRPTAPAPRDRIEAECVRRGRPAVIAGCVRLIHGDDADAGLIVVLGGPHARQLLAAGPPPEQRYWLRVWAARGLLWAWDAGDNARDSPAASALRTALGDDAWRVREMAAKVVARHFVGDALSAVSALRDDPALRVRTAARRAVAVLTRAGA